MNKTDLINSPISEYERLMKMDFLIRSGNYPSVDYLSREIGVDRRAIFRYRNILINDFGAPLETSRQYGGYYYSDPDFTISDITLNEHESLVLQLTKRFAQMMLYGSDLYSSFSRGINSLNKRASKTTNENGKKLADRIRFAFPHTDFGSTWNKHFEKLIFQSLQNGTLLKFEIRSFITEEITEFKALPIYIVMFENSWLLLCIKDECFKNNYSSIEMKIDNFILFDICSIKAIYECKDSHAKLVHIRNQIDENGRNGISDSVPVDENPATAHDIWFSFSISFPDFSDSEPYNVLLIFSRSNTDYTYSLTDNFIQDAAHFGQGKLDNQKKQDDFETLI